LVFIGASLSAGCLLRVRVAPGRRDDLGARGGDGHEDEEETEGKGPHGDAVRASLDLGLRARRTATRGYGLSGDDDCATAVDSLIIVPHRASSGGLHRLSFVVPAGLADGLALKELRYVTLTIRPWP
jgi:hypothetical protein